MIVETRLSGRRRGRMAAVSAGACVLVLVAGCSGHKRAAGPTPSLSFPPTTAPASTSAPATSAAPAAAALPRDCAQLVSLSDVQRILGVGLVGSVTYLKAAPVPQSGRTGRVTCGYGTPTTTPKATGTSSPTPVASGTPLVRLSYITYTDAATAKSRVALTVTTDAKTGTLTTTKVGGVDASVIVGSPWDELLMADGARTFVVEVSPATVSAAKAPAVLQQLAAAMQHFGAPSSAPASASAASS
jgi:hypothetical protein